MDIEKELYKLRDEVYLYLDEIAGYMAFWKYYMFSPDDYHEYVFEDAEFMEADLRNVKANSEKAIELIQTFKGMLHCLPEED